MLKNFATLHHLMLEGLVGSDWLRLKGLDLKSRPDWLRLEGLVLKLRPDWLRLDGVLLKARSG